MKNVLSREGDSETQKRSTRDEMRREVIKLETEELNEDELKGTKSDVTHK